MGKALGSGLFVTADNVEGTGSLTIETHDLGEGLSDDHLEALVEEVSESNTILVEVSGDETLIGSVEEWVESSLSADFSDSLPLIKSWINTSWVVSTGVEEDDGSWGGVAKISNHTLEVETLGLLVEVSVLSNLHTGSGENLVVVSPGWVREIDWSWSEFNKEISNDSQGTSSGKGLARSNSSAGNISMVPSEENSSGSLVEFGDTVNWEVFLFELLSNNLLLSSSDNWENVWLSIVGSVGTNSEVDLVWVLGGLVSNREGKNWISWGLLDVVEFLVSESGFLAFKLVVDESETVHLK